MTDFARAFKNDYNNISDAVQQERSASQVMSSHSAKLHDFFLCAWMNLFSKCVSISYYYVHQLFFIQVKNHLKRAIYLVIFF